MDIAVPVARDFFCFLQKTKGVKNRSSYDSKGKGSQLLE